MAEAKRRKTGNASESAKIATNVKFPLIDDLCERLLRCQEDNGNDTTSDDFNHVDRPPLPENIRAGVKQAASLLQEAITELQAAVDDASALAGSEAPVAANMLQGHELIAYAHRLSFTTSAPQGFVPGQTPLMHFKPPAPQDIQLRSSALHQFHRDYELRQKEGTRAAAYAAPTAETPAPPPGKEEQPSAPPVNLAEILSTLPPMPAGWKPGDPIPGLPAGMALPPHAAAALPPPQAPPPSTIPVGGPPASVEDTGVAAKESVPVAVPVTRPLSAAFDFALNPDMEMEFDVGDSSSESDSDSDSD